MSTQTLALLFSGFISTELGDTLMFSGNWSLESGPITRPSRSHCWTASQNFSPYVKTLFQFSPCAGSLADPLAPILKPSLRPVQILSILSRPGYFRVLDMSKSFTGHIQPGVDSRLGFQWLHHDSGKTPL